MPFPLRQLPPSDNFCQHLTLDAFEQVLPSAQIEAALAAFGPEKTRNRRLTPRSVVWLVIAMHLFSHASFAPVFGRLARGLRLLWPDSCYWLPGDAALSYRRYQLGAKPLVALFHAICKPLATRQTKGRITSWEMLLASNILTSDGCCLAWLEVEAWFPQDLSGRVVPFFAARHKNVDSVGQTRDQRVRVALGAQADPHLPAKSEWHRYLAASTGRWASC
jgi:hypothetical protein